LVSTATGLAQASPSRGRNIQACPAISDFFIPKGHGNDELRPLLDPRVGAEPAAETIGEDLP
jgi:hypothetical protein